MFSKVYVFVALKAYFLFNVFVYKKLKKIEMQNVLLPRVQEGLEDRGECLLELGVIEDGRLRPSHAKGGQQQPILFARVNKTSKEGSKNMSSLLESEKTFPTI